MQRGDQASSISGAKSPGSASYLLGLGHGERPVGSPIELVHGGEHYSPAHAMHVLEPAASSWGIHPGQACPGQLIDGCIVHSSCCWDKVRISLASSFCAMDTSQRVSTPQYTKQAAVSMQGKAAAARPRSPSYLSQSIDQSLMIALHNRGVVIFHFCQHSLYGHGNGSRAQT